MTDYIGLLRAVNLPGHNRVAMAALRELLLGLDLAEPRTLLQSGNFVFRGDARSPAVLERLLEAEAVRRLLSRGHRPLAAHCPVAREAARNPANRTQLEHGAQARRDGRDLTPLFPPFPLFPLQLFALA